MSPGTGAAEPPAGSGQLSHLDVSGRAQMVDVGAKPITAREAVASARLVVSPRTAALIAAGELPKGDALTIARIAGIQAAKRTSELIPLCHPVALTDVEVDCRVDVDRGEVAISATARAMDRTGVEMEAMVAASVAGLALYDLVKAVQRDARLTEVRVVAKSGGRTGTWTAPSA